MHERTGTSGRADCPNKVKSIGELRGAHGAEAIIVPAEKNGAHPAPAKPRAHAARPDPAEQAYRAATLRDIAARVRTEGPHVARAHADRARQFMPFAALKGYHEMAREQETVREPRRDMTEERALALSKKVASLHKGDIVRIVHYEDGAYRTLIGAIAEIDETFRSLTVVKRRITFDDVLSIEQLQ